MRMVHYKNVFCQHYNMYKKREVDECYMKTSFFPMRAVQFSIRIFLQLLLQRRFILNDYKSIFHYHIISAKISHIRNSSQDHVTAFGPPGCATRLLYRPIAPTESTVLSVPQYMLCDVYRLHKTDRMCRLCVTP